MPLGIRAHDLGKHPLDVSAEVLGATGLDCLQLALPKALEGFEAVPGALTPAIARQVGRAYADRGLGIAVLGCYINPIHPDKEARELGLRRFEELLRHARHFGSPVVATETGSLNPDCSYHPGTEGSAEAFDLVVSSFRRLARTAEAEGVSIGVEPVARSHTVSTPDRLAWLLEAVGSPSLGVLYDPANLLAAEDEGRFEAAVNAFLDRFGSRLVAVHAKDCRITARVKTNDLPAGTGQVPYEILLPRLRRDHPQVPVLMEDVGPATWQNVRSFLKSF